MPRRKKNIYHKSLFRDDKGDRPIDHTSRNGPLFRVPPLNADKLEDGFAGRFILDNLSTLRVSPPPGHDGIRGMIRAPLAQNATPFQSSPTTDV